MAQTIRVSLPGYNALTDNNPDHFALYADQDWVLIKEKVRGTFSVGGNTEISIPHNLGYVPFALAFVTIGSKVYTIYGQRSPSVSCALRVNSSNVYIRNFGSSSISGYYIIFYDNQV